MLLRGDSRCVKRFLPWTKGSYRLNDNSSWELLVVFISIYRRLFEHKNYFKWYISCFCPYHYHWPLLIQLPLSLTSQPPCRYTVITTMTTSSTTSSTTNFTHFTTTTNTTSASISFIIPTTSSTAEGKTDRETAVRLSKQALKRI